MDNFGRGNLVYLDNNATTFLDSRVLDTMLPYLKEFYGNPASSHHFGSLVRKEIDKAREKVADLLNANAREIIFRNHKYS
jgi:cysteine desulfurase